MQSPLQEPPIAAVDQHPAVRSKPRDLRLERAGFPWLLRDAARAEKYRGDGAVAGAVAASVDGAQRAL